MTDTLYHPTRPRDSYPAFRASSERLQLSAITQASAWNYRCNPSSFIAAPDHDRGKATLATAIKMLQVAAEDLTRIANRQFK